MLTNPSFFTPIKNDDVVLVIGINEFEKMKGFNVIDSKESSLVEESDISENFNVTQIEEFSNEIFEIKQLKKNLKI